METQHEALELLNSNGHADKEKKLSQVTSAALCQNFACWCAKHDFCAFLVKSCWFVCTNAF